MWKYVEHDMAVERTDEDCGVEAACLVYAWHTGHPMVSKEVVRQTREFWTPLGIVVSGPLRDSVNLGVTPAEVLLGLEAVLRDNLTGMPTIPRALGDNARNYLGNHVYHLSAAPLEYSPDWVYDCHAYGFGDQRRKKKGDAAAARRERAQRVHGRVEEARAEAVRGLRDLPDGGAGAAAAAAAALVDVENLAPAAGVAAAAGYAAVGAPGAAAPDGGPEAAAGGVGDVDAAPADWPVLVLAQGGVDLNPLFAAAAPTEVRVALLTVYVGALNVGPRRRGDASALAGLESPSPEAGGLP